jgi:hypothetical protein
MLSLQLRVECTVVETASVLSACQFDTVDVFGSVTQDDEPDPL